MNFNANKMLKSLEKALDIMLGVFLLLMGIFLFGNIVLRYIFNAGLVWAEELARFMFVWITFIGAIGALRANKHLGFSALVKKLPLIPKKIAFTISNTVILYILYLVLSGSIQMAKLGWVNIAPSTGIPLTFMWLAGSVCAFTMALIVIGNMYRAIFVPGAIEKLVDMIESEDEVHMEKNQEGGE